MRTQHPPNSKNLFIGGNCPNVKTFDKVFVEEEDCVSQCVTSGTVSGTCTASSVGGLIFDSWNDGSSCGMQEGQEVWAGCGYVYVVFDDCQKECGSCSNTNIYFVS